MNSLFTEDGIKKLTVRQCLAFEFPPYYGNDSVPYKILNAEGTSDINVLELKFLCRPPALYKMRANLKRNQGKAVYIPNPEIGTINGQDLDILINLSETKAKIQNITQLIKYVSESLRLPQSAELLKDMRLKCCLIPAPLRKEVQLDLSQLCCLMTYNWLVDSVIDSIFLFVHRQSWIDIPNIYFGGIDLSGSIQKVYRQRCTTDRNLKIWTEPIKKRLRTTPELELFLSWNHSSMHWGCVRIKFKHKTIEVFDSIRGTIPIRECKAMLEYYLEFYLNVEEMSLWKRKKVEIGVTPQQDDGHSCGIITINTIERLLGIDVEEWLPAKKEQHRHRILLLLMDAMELLDVQGKRKLQQLETELSGVGATMDPVPSQPSIFNNNEAQDSVPTQPSIFINNEAQDPVPSQQSTIINNEAQDPVHRQQAGITDDNAVVEKQVQADFPLLFTKEHITVDCHCSSVHPAIADLECQASKAGISIKILDAMIREEKFQSTMCTTTSCSKFSGNIEVIPKGSRFKSQQALNAVLQFGKRLKGIIVLQIWCGEWNEMIYFPRYSEGEPREFAVFCRKEEKTSLEVAFAEIQKWAVGNGFDITKGRSKGDGNGGIQSWRIQCPHSRKYAPRKHPDSAVHRNRKSGGTHCPFYVKIHLASQAKQVILNLQNTDTIITSFFLGHNHAVHPDDSAMLKSTCFFTKEMREEVMRLYKLKSSTDTILRTLRLKYPTKTITVKAIHNARLGMGAGSAYDAEEFVKALERAKEEDPAFLYFTDIDAITGQLRRAFWCHPRQLELIHAIS